MSIYIAVYVNTDVEEEPGSGHWFETTIQDDKDGTARAAVGAFISQHLAAVAPHLHSFNPITNDCSCGMTYRQWLDPS